MSNLRNEDRIIDSEELEELIPYSRMTIWRQEQRGDFPKRIILGKGKNAKIGWSAQEIAEWIEAKKAERGPMRKFAPEEDGDSGSGS